MVLTSNETGISSRFSHFFFWLWGIMSLFFATIFNDPKKLDPKGGNFGNGGGKKMNGMQRKGPSMGGG